MKKESSGHYHSSSHHCKCGLREQLRKFRAGKLGLLGGILIVGHLLFHVAECLIIPAVIIALNGNSAETMELGEVDFPEISLADSLSRQDLAEVGIYQLSLAYNVSSALEL